MSKGLLTNPKTMLGIAGAVVVMALAASVGLKSFVSDGNETPVEVAVVEQPPAPAEPVAGAGWEDSGMADDWGGSDSGMDDGGWGDTASVSQPSFGDYKPEVSETVDDGGATASPGPAVANTRTIGGVKVTSQAAEGAPPVSPPG